MDVEARSSNGLKRSVSGRSIHCRLARRGTLHDLLNPQSWRPRLRWSYLRRQPRLLSLRWLSPYVPTALNAQTAIVVAAPMRLGPAAMCDARAELARPTPRGAASSASDAGSASRDAVLAVEESEIARAVHDFLEAVPRELLLYSHSALPDADRVAARKRHLLTCLLSVCYSKYT